MYIYSIHIYVQHTKSRSHFLKDVQKERRQPSYQLSYEIRINTSLSRPY